MDENIELKERGREEDKSSEEARERQEKEETSFTERTEEAEDDYDNIRSRISPDSIDQGETNEGFKYDDEYDLTSLEKMIQDSNLNKQMIRREAIRALESATGVRFDVSYGENSKNLIDYVSDVKFRKRDGVLIKLKYKGEKVVLTKEGKIDKRSIHKNKQIWEAIAAANEEYEKTFDAVANEGAGLSLSDEAISSVQENTIEGLESFIDERYKELSIDDPDKNIKREINGIMHVDDNIDYDDLADPDQRAQYDAKIAGLKVNIEHWKYLEQREQDPTKKQLYKTAKELCITKKSYMEVKANQRLESEDGAIHDTRRS